MNYIAFDEPIGLFANVCFHFVSYFKQVWLVTRGKTHTTKSIRDCQLINNCTDYQFVYAEILVRTVCGGGFKQEKIFIKGLSFANRGIMGKAYSFRVWPQVYILGIGDDYGG